jgi:pimeloyl-ACP methyl ester carboxylesterase
MLTVATLVLAALFRAASLAPATSRKLYRYLISGSWLGLAGWTLGAVLQAWVPIWEMLVVGVALSLLAAFSPGKFQRYARPLADFFTIVSLGALSVIPVQLALVVSAALAFAVAGYVLDRFATLLSPRLHPAVLAMPAVLALILGLQVRQPGNFGSRLLEEDPLFPLRAALVVPTSGERLPLQQGTAAWLLETPIDEPRGTAVVLHGNHRNGSRQPSGIVLQGALLRAGYDVLAIDHPGFGSSAAPAATAGWREWDPAFGALQALRYLESQQGADLGETIIVGHSMGVDVALKVAADGARASAVYLWGGSLDRPYGPNWLNGFHRERNLPCCLPTAVTDRIRAEFYGGGDRFAAALPADHPPVHFVRFGIEHADVTRDRELLYAAIPEPKQLCDFDDVSHYFNTLSLRGFVLIDTLTRRETAAIFGKADPADEICGR